MYWRSIIFGEKEGLIILGGLMNWLMKIGCVLALLFILISTVNACNVNISGLKTDLRTTNDFSTTMTTGRSEDIDVRVTFDVTSFSGSDCPTNLETKSIIKRYNTSTSAWETVKTTSTKTQNLSNGPFYFLWENEFNTGSNTNYTRYEVEGSVYQGTTLLDSEIAYVDVQDNSCTGVKIVVDNFSVDEGRSTSKQIRIENNTNYSFSISALNIYFSNSIIRSGSLDYDNYVSAHSYESATLSVDAAYVSSNTTTTGVIDVSGYLGGTYCSITNIGRKNVDITVRDLGYNDSGYYDDGYYDNYSSGTSADCSNIALNANSFSMSENSEGKFSVNVRNNSTKRFEILQVQTTSNGVELSNYYNEKYIFSGQISDIVLKAVSPNVTQDKVFENKIKVRGIFSDGKSCSFDNIGEKAFNISVANETSTVPNCSAFSISVSNIVNVTNSGTVQFTINNGTNKRADIYVEGNIEATPTIISLPEKTSISRTLDVKLNSPNGVITFRPVVEGCSLSTTQVQVNNLASGALNNATITTSTTRDENTGTVVLSVEVNNPTTKMFEGTLTINAPNGWIVSSRSATLSPGRNIFKIIMTPTSEAVSGTGRVTFTANNESVSSEFSTNNGSSFAALFSFGASAGSIAMILLIIVVVVILVGMISNREYDGGSQMNQVWVEKKD